MPNPICCDTLSSHEQRVQDQIEGKEDKFRATHQRVFTILESFDGKKPRIDVERVARYFTQSMRQTEGQALVLAGQGAQTYRREHHRLR